MSALDEVSLINAERKLDQLREIIKAGLNAGNGDGEWEALVDAGDLLGLDYDEEEDKYA
jgi:hypothetical protein